MDFPKLQKQYLAIEKKYDLYHIEIRGVNIWQYFRTELWNEIWNYLSGGTRNDPTRDSRQGETSIGKRAEIKIFLQKAGYALTHRNGSRIHPADVLFISFGRRFYADGVYVDKYIGELEGYFRGNSVMIELNRNFDLPLHPTPSQQEYYPELPAFGALLRTRLVLAFRKSLYRSVLEEVRRSFSEPLKEISDTFGYPMDVSAYCAEFAMQLLKIKGFKSCYRRLLKKISPKVILETIPNSRFSMIFNELAKEQGIPTIELQHAVPINNLIWNYADGCSPVRQFPDYEFGYSEYFNSHMHLPIPRQNIKAVGLPYLDRSLRLYPRHKTDPRTTILFISQGPVAKQLSRLAVEIRKSLDSRLYRIIYKLHPEESVVWRERIPWLHACADIEVIDDRTYDTYRCFAESDIQIGVHSTALLEGMAYSLDTYIYRTDGWEFMREIVDSGYATLITDEKDFIDKVTSTGIRNTTTKDNLWKRNAVGNMLHEIERISGVRGQK